MQNINKPPKPDERQISIIDKEIASLQKRKNKENNGKSKNRIAKRIKELEIERDELLNKGNKTKPTSDTATQSDDLVKGPNSTTTSQERWTTEVFSDTDAARLAELPNLIDQAKKNWKKDSTKEERSRAEEAINTLEGELDRLKTKQETANTRKQPDTAQDSKSIEGDSNNTRTEETSGNKPDNQEGQPGGNQEGQPDGNLNTLSTPEKMSNSVSKIWAKFNNLKVGTGQKVADYTALYKEANSLAIDIDKINDPSWTNPQGKGKKSKKEELNTKLEALIKEIASKIESLNKEAKEKSDKIAQQESPENIRKEVDGLVANKSAIDKEASEARKDGDKTRESLEKDTIDELTEKYNLLTEDIDSKINDITAIIDKIDQTPTPENEKKRSLLEREKNRLEKLKKSIDAAKAKLSEKNYSERFKKMEEKVKAMKEAMNRAEELLKKATILSSKEIKTEGPNAAVRFLKKFGNISTFSAEDKLEYVSTLAERAEIIRQVKGFYKSSLTEMYELGTAGLSPEDDKKRKGIIDQIKDIREKMYANKTRRFSMVLKNILKSPTLEIAAATEMGGIAGRRYMGAIEDSFSPNKEKRDAARGELMKGTALVGGAVGAVAGGLVISAMVGGGLGAGLALGVKAANDEYYKMSA